MSNESYPAMRYIFHRTDRIIIPIYNPCKGRVAIYPGFAKHLAQHGTCAYCGGSINPLLIPCQCAIPTRYDDIYDDPGDVRLLVSIPHELVDELTKWRRNNDRTARYYDLKKSSATKRERQLLWKAQEGSCYYCGGLLTCNSSDPDDIVCHMDHIIPYNLGGTDVIENLAFSCPKCNQRKWADSEKDFIKKLDNELSPERLTVAKRIRKQRAKFIKELLLQKK